ncbi:FRG domain-containing protein [Psychromonas aquimarina]|uniref:FRG domain-containing protein n=1 Tax=Psychromonas aquimarina TaxID=444919 RepID=UPI000416BB63|nr:FRG domain-containing protein [Psychromonas aquimarina]
MKGQWIGKYTGDVDGKIMVNIDDVGKHYEVVAYINPYDKHIPSTVAYFDPIEKAEKVSVKAYLAPVNPENGLQAKWEDIKGLFPDGVNHSNEADVDFVYDGTHLKISATTDIGVNFNSLIKKSEQKNDSSIDGIPMSWVEYKNHVSGLLGKGYLFRGQQKPWRLQTTFHRLGRYRISEFTNVDVKQLHQRLCAITPHFFDLNDPQQNGAFFNLLQHHGYPTPLLDWSYSPFVSAFFAFRDCAKNYSGDEAVRVYLFNYDKWKFIFPQITTLDPPFPHLSVTDFIALDNPRMIPQQALTTVTNLENIEAYLQEKEAETGECFIEAIDIPANDRELAMKELGYMGITAGSMFPGVDGVCEELRERNFDK